jgi:hypothetical protein
MNRSERLDFAKFPVYFPVTREFVAETGSTVTASATTQSVSNGDFPGFGEKPRIGGLACWCLVSASGQVDSNGHLRAFVSGLKIAFPGNRDRRQAETGSNAALLLGKAKNLMLLGPFGGQVGEASNPHAMRQPPVDSRLD